MFKKPIIQNSIFQGIMGHDEFLAYQETLTIADRKGIVLISISEPDNDKYVSDCGIHTIGFDDILEMKFWDIEEPLINEEKGMNYDVISDEQGKEIKDFIVKNKDKKFLIHCKAGISRSAGVGKAVECLVHYHGDVYIYRISPSEIDNFKRYFPNQTVFDVICK